MNNNRKLNPDQLEEYRRRRLAIQRQAVRRVKYTLLVIALLAGCWFLFLTWKDAGQSQYEPGRIETITPAQNESPAPLHSPSPRGPQATSTPATTPAHDTQKTEVAPDETVPVPSDTISGQFKPPEPDKNSKVSPKLPGQDESSR